ncbi:DUF4157 domain-containing protein [Fulvivirga ulvae]|uniref:eCIS core domain-containing protein n=1 Tax=Fulvivirga ulvae TaxID=2904245 RepID=UPI001F1652E0|nr:DUF4157 domain-containing protein [Fulvivirga ulvae]UII32766.1 DUF4157 domain-containing protein [Fulvivirga ulvae]
MRDNILSNNHGEGSRLNKNMTSLDRDISKSQHSLIKNHFADLHSDNNQLSLNTKNPANETGLPNELKAGIENLSGHSLDDVKVNYNSSKPAQLQAHAYAQGTEIHLAPGQERHLPHEAWHVVQQKQGRVKPTVQLKDTVNINDDTSLEKEADVMGSKALQMNIFDTITKQTTVNQNNPELNNQDNVTQRKLIFHTPKNTKKNKKHNKGWRSFENTVFESGSLTEDEIKAINIKILQQACSDIPTLQERMEESNNNSVIVERGLHCDQQDSESLEYTPESEPHLTIKFVTLGGANKASFHVFAKKVEDSWNYSHVQANNEDAKKLLEEVDNVQGDMELDDDPISEGEQAVYSNGVLQHPNDKKLLDQLWVEGDIEGLINLGHSLMQEGDEVALDLVEDIKVLVSEMQAQREANSYSGNTTQFKQNEQTNGGAQVIQLGKKGNKKQEKQKAAAKNKRRSEQSKADRNAFRALQYETTSKQDARSKQKAARKFKGNLAHGFGDSNSGKQGKTKAGLKSINKEVAEKKKADKLAKRQAAAKKKHQEWLDRQDRDDRGGAGNGHGVLVSDN